MTLKSGVKAAENSALPSQEYIKIVIFHNITIAYFWSKNRGSVSADSLVGRVPTLGAVVLRVSRDRIPPCGPFPFPPPISLSHSLPVISLLSCQEKKKRKKKRHKKIPILLCGHEQSRVAFTHLEKYLWWETPRVAGRTSLPVSSDPISVGARTSADQKGSLSLWTRTQTLFVTVRL